MTARLSYAEQDRQFIAEMEALALQRPLLPIEARRVREAADRERERAAKAAIVKADPYEGMAMPTRPPVPKWTPEEDRIIRRAIKRGTEPRYIVPLLPGRTLAATKARTQRLKEKQREANRVFVTRWREANRDAHRQAARNWVAANRERHKANSARWAKENREKRNALNRAYRERRKERANA